MKKTKPQQNSPQAIRIMRAGLSLAGVKGCVVSLFANIDALTDADELELEKIYKDIHRVAGRAIGIDTDAEAARDEARLAEFAKKEATS